MSLISTKLNLSKSGRTEKITDPESAYKPEIETKKMQMAIRDDFTLGYTIMQKPRKEFNDMSFTDRDSVDTMSWAVYQPNDGAPMEGDTMSWRSNAVRPIVRNKVFSIAAHIAARTLFPKIMAFDDDSIEQHDAAQTMSDLMEWSTLSANATYADVSLRAVITALVRPVSIVQTQYCEVYRNVKRKKNDDGTWEMEKILDEDNSGFIDESVPPEQIFIGDWYQSDIQKQGWVIRRRVRPYSTLRALYEGVYDNFKYVKPGIQCILNDANMEFYDVYDTEMSQDDGEEILYWNKNLDLYLIQVNGVMLTDYDNPNPREDKLYPFASFGYEYLRPNGDCWAWKSLAFKTMPDDKIVNTLYPMIIDGTYLAIMPPMINVGGEIIESDVIVPGGVTTFSSPDADLKPIAVQNENLKAGMDALFKVEENITEDAFNPTLNGDMPEGGGNLPAYNLSQMEKNARIQMGPFIEMIGRYVKQMGRLRIGDIKQHLTMPEVSAIEGSENSDLIYKTFVLPQGKARSKSKKISFNLDMPEGEMSSDERLKQSYGILKKENEMSLSEVNPSMFRNLKYMCFVGVDVLQPMSEELEAEWNLAVFDRAIASPEGMFDPIEIGGLLLEVSPTTKKHPDKYLPKQDQISPVPSVQPVA